METLDIETFIIEVHERPAIWDVKCSDYANKDRKNKAWDEIVDIFIGKEDASDEEKIAFGMQLHRRWKSLRDSYSREAKLQKLCESGSVTRNRPVYIFYKQLSFLETVVSTTQPRPNSSTDNWESGECIPKRKKQDVVGERLVSAIERSVELLNDREKEAENDSDRLFLLSLLNPLKEIPEYSRFVLKRKIMDLVEAELSHLYRPMVVNPFQQNFSSMSHPHRPTYNMTGVGQPYAASRQQMHGSAQFHPISHPPRQNAPTTSSSYYDETGIPPQVSIHEHEPSQHEMHESEANSPYSSDSIIKLE